MVVLWRVVLSSDTPKQFCSGWLMPSSLWQDRSPHRLWWQVVDEAVAGRGSVHYHDVHAGS
jgi:hypothetical protein